MTDEETVRIPQEEYDEEVKMAMNLAEKRELLLRTTMRVNLSRVT
jgi:hypothetical protein